MLPLLDVADLRTVIASRGGEVEVLRGVSLAVAAGERLGIVGESGSGKSMTVLAVMGLLPRAARIAGGSISFAGADLARASAAAMRQVRGRRIGMVFQDPMTSLNPLLTIRRQLTEGMEAHLGLSSAESGRRAFALLERVRIDRPARVLDSYPHHLSGGMRQRVVIAMALACRPQLLIADEPTTALDATVQAEVMAMLRELTRDEGTAVILISHSLDLVAGDCDRVAVMYAGRVAEIGPTTPVVQAPLHPYTADLIDSVPHVAGPRVARFPVIDGQPPVPGRLPRGCPYHPRCRRRVAICDDREPAIGHAAHAAACWLAHPPCAPNAA